MFQFILRTSKVASVFVTVWIIAISSAGKHLPRLTPHNAGRSPSCRPIGYQKTYYEGHRTPYFLALNCSS